MREMQGFNKANDLAKFSSKGRTVGNLPQNKDENTVNHEIATLLLNLASRTQNTCSGDRTYDNSPSNDTTEAMDLSNYAKSAPIQAPKNKVERPTYPKVTNTTTPTMNPYSLLSPSTLASMANITGSSLTSSLSSSYLLQNLLMQQLSSPHLLSTASSPTTVKQAPISTPSKTPTPVTVSPSSLLSLPSLSTSSATNIPLLSGQIVAQLNSLLFSIHGIQDKNTEMNVQGQLAAIYTRLQEIVAMVQLAKKKPAQDYSQKSSSKSPVSSHDSAMKSETVSTGRQAVDLVTSSREREEQKIARQLEEYQKALAQTSVSSSPQLSTSTVSSLLLKQTPVSEESLSPDVTSAGPQVKEEEVLSPTGTDYSEAISSSVPENRRLSRDSYSDLAPESPPEKKSRLSEGTPLAISSSGRVGSNKGGKGGKGIRNRVFCGDCPGCLKNDDCGQCRYCRDKTKFGGQNRLRQKCLHRRCQMDTHRRSSGGAVQQKQQHSSMRSPTPPGQSQPTPSPQDIYSGVELAARLAATGTLPTSGVDHAIFSSFLGNVNNMRPTAGVVGKLKGDEERMESGEEERQREEEREEREDSKEREEFQQSRRDKWKAKHEAMLKLATTDPVHRDTPEESSNEERKTVHKHLSDDRLKSHSLVITLNETTKELNDPHSIRKKSDDISFSRNLKTKTFEASKQDAARLSTRSMKTVLAV